jgi:hypothetical protein
MNWISRLLLILNKRKSAPAALVQPPPLSIREDGDRDLSSEMDSLVIRMEVLMPLIQRWPSNDKDLKDWDRVAEKVKETASNPMSAAVELEIRFTPTFWTIALCNVLYNLETCSLLYLEQQAALFYVDGGPHWFEEEIYLICRISVALKRISDYSSSRPFDIEDCRDIFSLAKVLPPTENRNVFALLAFVSNHTVLRDDFTPANSDLDFWSELVDLLNNVARTCANPSQIATASRARQLLFAFVAGAQNDVIVFRSNRD